MAQLALKMALSHYDRHIPFFDSTVRPEGIDLTVLEVGESIPLRHGAERHARMLQHGEFDVCEVSLSSDLMAKSRRGYRNGKRQRSIGTGLGATQIEMPRARSARAREAMGEWVNRALSEARSIGGSNAVGLLFKRRQWATHPGSVVAVVVFVA